MLEYDFNELDNDFISLWSKYLLTNDTSKIMKNITKLAELGQINAIQSYYILTDEENKQIDSFTNKTNLPDVNSASANLILAKTHRLYQELQRDLECLREIKDRNTESYHTLVREFNEKILTYLCGVETYLKAASYHYGLTRNALVAERLIEVSEGVGKNNLKHLKDANEYCNSRLDLSDTYKPQLFLKSTVAKLLKDMYVAEPKNPQVAFAYAKNLLFFSFGGKKKAEACSILQELSERELSETLRNYELTTTSTDEMQA